jgi:hypothetical protein
MNRPIRLEIYLILLLCVGLFVYTIDLAAHPARCPCTNVLVYAEKQSDIDIVCKAATDTVSFMVEAGLDVQCTFDIHLTENIEILPQQNLYLGVYKHQQREIHILSYECCEQLYKDDCCCSVGLSRELHTSIIVHEIAHALTVELLENEIGRIAAAEYIAYTTQFSLMPDKLREKILIEISNEGFINEAEITSLFHDLNPSVFAVKAYRHFIRPENGIRFYNKLISGTCILDLAD